MKKAIIPVLSLLLLYACSDNKEKNKPTGKENEQTTDNGSPDISAGDKAIKEWLLGKEWKAESKAAPIGTLRTYSMDSCDYVYGKSPWNFKKGHLTFGAHDLVG